jgi:preprotein translocase subunit SecF
VLDIVGKRNWYFAASLAIIILGIISMASVGFRLGIDFVGGTDLTLKFQHPVRAADVQTAMDRYQVQATVQQAGPDTVFITTVPLNEKEGAITQELANRFGGIDQAASTSTTVGPVVAQQLVGLALLLITIASAGIVVYLTLRFDFKFAVCAIIALLHDVFVLAGIFSILGQVFHLQLAEINVLFVTAALTVVGFSVHDTIVIFDRIRENLRTSRVPFEAVVNLSIVQSFARSLNTSMTVLFVLLALFLITTSSIKGFTLALLIGIISGTYSSIFNASPLLVVWKSLAPDVRSRAQQRAPARV